MPTATANEGISNVSTAPTPNMSLTPVSYKVENNEPWLGGIKITDLVKTHGTPLYVMDEATLRTMARAYTETLKACYPAESLPLYACKAHMSMGLVRLMEQEGMGLDVVSGGELYTALQARFPAERIFFNGNNKTTEELELAVHHQIGRISVDNFSELELLHKVAGQKNRRVDVILRVTPGIECHTHDYIKTGQTDTKFGFDLSTLSRAIDLITGDYKETINLKGLHAHIGSQIFEVRPYEDLVEILINIFFNIRQAYDGLTMTDLNIGGGMGIRYTGEDDPPNVAWAIERITTKIKNYCEQIDYPLPRLIMEPGRSMVATAGMTLYTVGGIKEIPNIRKYVAVDGGMGDNIRPALYQARYTAQVANKLGQPAEETVTLVGRYCESGDVLIPGLSVPKIETGDILMVFATGAYNYSMSSNYNRFPRPAVVLVNEGKSHVLVRRETYDTVIQQDVIPPHLLEPNH